MKCMADKRVSIVIQFYDGPISRLTMTMMMMMMVMLKIYRIYF